MEKLQKKLGRPKGAKDRNPRKIVARIHQLPNSCPANPSLAAPFTHRKSQRIEFLDVENDVLFDFGFSQEFVDPFHDDWAFWPKEGTNI